MTQLNFRSEYRNIEAVVFRDKSSIPELFEFAGGHVSDLYDNKFGLTCSYMTADGQDFQLYPGCALYRIAESSRIHIAPWDVLCELFVVTTKP